MTATPNQSRLINAIVSRPSGPVAGPESLVDAVIDAPGVPLGHDLLVEVKAVSVNPVDVKVRAGRESGSPDRVLGWDAAGTVLAVGDQVTRFRPGDDVFYAGALDRPGSDADQQLVDERIVGPKPSTLDFPAAAALPLTGITAWEALFDKLQLTTDTTGTLLVLGAAGGVGSMLIQLAKALTGVRIIATASRPESRSWVESLGADVIINHSAPDFAGRILAAAPGGVDYLFSSQSGGRTALFTEVVRPFGQIVAIDDATDVDLMALKDKSISWHWEFMFTRARHGFELESQRDLLTRIAELIDTGRIRTTLTQMLSPLAADTLREAHRIVESGRAIGKIVVARPSGIR